MGKMADFEKMLDSVGNPIDLKKYYRDNKCEKEVTYDDPNPDPKKPPVNKWSLMEQLSSCSGAARFTTAYFTGSITLANSTANQNENLAPGQETAFGSKFGQKPNRIAYTTGFGHDFVLVKEGGAFALYQANIATVPRYTLCKGLNNGVEYNVRGMDGSAFAALLLKLTNADESNKIFKNKNNLTTYKAIFAEF